MTIGQEVMAKKKKNYITIMTATIKLWSLKMSEGKKKKHMKKKRVKKNEEKWEEIWKNVS